MRCNTFCKYVSYEINVLNKTSFVFVIAIKPHWWWYRGDIKCQASYEYRPLASLTNNQIFIFPSHLLGDVAEFQVWNRKINLQSLIFLFVLFFFETGFLCVASTVLELAL